MFVSQLLDDLGAGGGHVAQNFAAGPALELVEHRGRKTVGIGGKDGGVDHPGKFPVAGGRILAGRCFLKPAERPRRPHARGKTLHPVQLAQAQFLQVRQMQAALAQGQVPQGVGPLVPVVSRVGQRPGSHAVQNDPDQPLDHPASTRFPALGCACIYISFIFSRLTWV